MDDTRIVNAHGDELHVTKKGSIQISAARPSESDAESDDSIPSLQKIKFDDHIVSITDPEPTDKLKKGKKGKKKNEAKGDLTPPEAVKTAETFEIGRNSEELILCGPGNKREVYKVPHKNKDDNESKKKDKQSTNEPEAKQSPPQSVENEEIAPDEPCIRIGDRLLSRDETASLLKKLAELKNEENMPVQKRRSWNLNMSYRGWSNIPSTDQPSTPAVAQQRSVAGEESGQKGESTEKKKSGKPFENCPNSTKDSPPDAKKSTKKRHQSGRESNLSREMVDQSFRRSRVPRPRPNFHRIESCRTSRANSPLDAKNSGIPRRKILLGDHFMTVEEAEDLLQRLLKANAKSARRGPSRLPSKESTMSREVVEDDKSRGRAGAKRDKRQTTGKGDSRAVTVPAMEPPKNEDADCNFSHLNSVIRTEDEVNALILSIIVGAILFIGLCLIVSKRA
uniref:Protein kinase domain-containing protein n=1 Tax=Haemonchus contortus TaxID=6289 RepID=A0A7I5E5P7_HAECO|nr:unnamed protein product [Haemonchus contortus]